MLEQFSRTQLLLGPEAMDALQRARVAIFGLGGVGGYVCEALARSGVGSLVLIDHDKVSLTNLNRQVIATLDAIGQEKSELMAKRVLSINPTCKVEAHTCFFLPETASQFNFSSYDYVVDAVDTVTGKLQIIQAAKQASVPVISSMGAANKLDPTRFEIADIYDTRICPLARIIRKECRKRGIESLKVVYSTEPARALYPRLVMDNLLEDDEAKRAADIDLASEGSSRHGTPGSVAFVPSVAGMILASEIVKDLVGGFCEA